MLGGVATLTNPDVLQQYLLSHIEYLHDNTLNPTQNTWNGLRYKIYYDVNTPIGVSQGIEKSTYNFGYDVRYYKSIYRNFIWAARGAADFSWGKEKIVYYPVSYTHLTLPTILRV